MKPRVLARIAGALYVLIFVFAPSGAGTATPAKIIVTLACDTCIAFIFYGLFKVVSRRISLLAAVLRLAFVAIIIVNALNLFGLIDLTGTARSAAEFDFLYGIALVPFGLHCLLVGYLVFNSTFMPRFIGVLMMLAGLAYSIFVWPALGERLFFPYIAVPGVLGEGALTLWLLIMGIDAKRWSERAAAA